jgi:uncharacterized protein YigA (DUF484 family)
MTLTLDSIDTQIDRVRQRKADTEAQMMKLWRRARRWERELAKLGKLKAELATYELWKEGETA